MKWFWLVPKDQRQNNWFLYDEVPPVVLRKRYQWLQCAECGKIDEDQALLSGLDADVQLKARSDIVQTSDEVLCFSEKTRKIYELNNLTGLEFMDIPKDFKYKIAFPTHILDVDLKTAAFQYQEPCIVAGIELPGGFCTLCGRNKGGAYVGPLKGSFDLPNNPLTICAPSINRENSRGKIYWILVSEVVKNLFQLSHVTGAEYSEIR